MQIVHGCLAGFSFSCGTVVVFRNFKGEALVARTKFVESLCGVVDAKALTLLFGLKVASEMVFLNI